MTTEEVVKEIVRMAKSAMVVKMASRNVRNPKEDEDRKRSRKPLQLKRRRPMLPLLWPPLQLRLLPIPRRRLPRHRLLLHQHQHQYQHQRQHQLQLQLQLLQHQLPLLLLPSPPQLLLLRPEVAGPR